MKWLERLVTRSRPYLLFELWLKRLKLPGYEIPIYNIVVFFLKEIRRESLNVKATSLAFNFLLAIFPAIIFLFTLIPYIPVTNFQEELLQLLADLLPTNAFEAAKTTLMDIIKIKNGELLSVGFLLALFFSTNGVYSLMSAFNKTSLVQETRTGIKKRIIATMLTFMVSLVVITGVTVLVVGEYVIAYLQSVEIISWLPLFQLLLLIRWLVIFGLFLTAISLLYYYGPATVKRWRFLSAGSLLATFLAIATSIAFSYYINNFGQYNKLYGSIGTLIVIMIWLYVNSLIILVGFELNASIDISKRTFVPPPPQPQRNKLKKIPEL